VEDAAQRLRPLLNGRLDAELAGGAVVTHQVVRGRGDYAIDGGVRHLTEPLAHIADQDPVDLDHDAPPASTASACCSVAVTNSRSVSLLDRVIALSSALPRGAVVIQRTRGKTLCSACSLPAR